MTSLTTILTPWYRRPAGRVGGDALEPGSVAPTAILDLESADVACLVERARTMADRADQPSVLEAAHSIIRDEVRAVYAMDESTPASNTLARGYGSCSQRLAILESVARAIGVPTRVRALLIDRSFWYPRFPRVGFLLPEEILLIWPEFEVDGWRSASELFGSIGCRAGGGFTNSGAETLFEAVGRCAVDWDGATDGGVFDLSQFVRADHGTFASRDEAFERLGQTLCTPTRMVIDPVMRRIAA